jgi:hypothetical protein
MINFVDRVMINVVDCLGNTDWTWREQAELVKWTRVGQAHLFVRNDDMTIKGKFLTFWVILNFI